LHAGLVDRERRRAGHAVRAGRAVHGSTQADLGKAVGVGRAHQRLRLRQPRGGFAHAGVGLGGALHQRIQLRVGEGLPPFAAALRFGRRGGGPARVLLELRRRARLRRQFGQRGGAAASSSAATSGRSTWSSCQDSWECTGRRGTGRTAPPPLAGEALEMRRLPVLAQRPVAGEARAARHRTPA
jgi:hypothetical protein